MCCVKAATSDTMLLLLTRVDHGGYKLNIYNVGEVTRFVQAVKAFHGHELTNNFIGDLHSTINEC